MKQAEIDRRSLGYKLLGAFTLFVMLMGGSFDWVTCVIGVALLAIGIIDSSYIIVENVRTTESDDISLD
jgi:hypothetical protein